MKSKCCFFLISVFCIYHSQSIFGQASCFNIGFENGTTDGYNIFYGEVDGADVTIMPGTTAGQHIIKRKTDGFDEIAELNCFTNKELPVVGLGLGQYSLKLGDDEGGSIVARITRDMFITEENNFLILNYAVILEDPSHDEISQPRFSLNIQDENGETFSCGEYLVSAGPNIEGFENCGDWRVRPWTSAGFELQSFLGQNIHLEITSLDCSFGGHGGYAYIDLNCKPLEILLDNYCEDETEAYLTVTNGFDEYLWNTGETTPQITITNPVPGEEYWVEVTSSTGCTITLRDTLPFFETLPTPSLQPFQDQTLCDGDYFYYIPIGQNIDRVEHIETGEIAEEFLIFPSENTTYHFAAKNIHGCDSDTISFHVSIKDRPKIDDVDITACNSDDKGSVFIHSSTDNDLVYSIDGNIFQSEPYFSNLEEGTYTVYVKSANNCLDSALIDVTFYNAVEIISNTVTNLTCNEFGSIGITLFNDFFDYTCYLNNVPFQNQRYFLPLDSGWYHLVFKNEMNCMDSIDLYVEEREDPFIDSVSITPYICGPNGGTLSIFGTDDSSLSYSINDSPYQTDPYFDNLYTGTYTITIKDEDGCLANATIFINEEPSLLEMSIIEKTNPTCELDNGSILLKTIDGFSPYYYSVNGSTFEENPQFENLQAGACYAVVRDLYGCLDTLDFELINSEKPVIVVSNTQAGTCGDENGSIQVTTLGGTSPFLYQIDNAPFQSAASFKNLTTGFYTLTVKDSYECTSSIEVYVRDACQLFIPNVFAYNTESIDGLFYIQSKRTAEIIIDHLSIYNRWGNLVYDGKDLMPNDPNDRWWDGTFNGRRAMSGVYTYIIKYTERSYEPITITGSITLL